VFWRSLRYHIFSGISRLTSNFVPGFQLDKPVFIIGAQRSGTRLIRDCLLASGELVSWSEANHVWEPHYFQTFDLSKTNPAIPGFFGKGIHAHEIPKRYEADLKKRVRSQFWFYTKLFGKRLIHQNPFNSVRPNLLVEWFENSRVVHICRDVRAAVNSFVQKNKNIELGAHYSETELARAGAYRWKYCLDKIGEARDRYPERIARIRYSDLSGPDSEAILRDLYEFCALDTAGEPWQDGPTIENRNYKWQKSLSEQSLQTVEEEINNTRPGETVVP
jgi:hypothetical protein